MNEIEAAANCPCPPKGFKLEKEFQTWLGAKLTAAGWFYYKLPDTGFDYKPYDFDAVSLTGKHYHVECKAVEGTTCAFAAFRPQQVTCLRKIASLDPESAWCIVYSKQLNKFKAFKWADYEASLDGNRTVRIWTFSS